MDDLARSFPEQLIHDGTLKSFSWGFVVASVTAAFLQELVLDVKSEGNSRTVICTSSCPLWGWGGPPMVFVSPFGERFIVVGLAGVFWILFEIKKRRRGSKR